jgi:hypothetical protein
MVMVRSEEGRETLSALWLQSTNVSLQLMEQQKSLLVGHLMPRSSEAP